MSEFLGFECNDSDWFEWFHSFRVKSIDHHLENEFIPFFSKVGLIAKLGKIVIDND